MTEREKPSEQSVKNNLVDFFVSMFMRKKVAFETVSSEEQIPTVEQLIDQGLLTQLAEQSHFIDRPTPCVMNGESVYVWYITSKPITPMLETESPWIEEDTGDQWLHRTADDEGIPFWQFVLTPEQDEIANKMMDDWTDTKIKTG